MVKNLTNQANKFRCTSRIYTAAQKFVVHSFFVLSSYHFGKKVFNSHGIEFMNQ